MTCAGQPPSPSPGRREHPALLRLVRLSPSALSKRSNKRLSGSAACTSGLLLCTIFTCDSLMSPGPLRHWSPLWSPTVPKAAPDAAGGARQLDNLPGIA